MRRTGPTNIHLRLLASYLRGASKAYGSRLWKRVAELLLVRRRARISVNLSRINRYTKEGDIIVVPGKVLGAGRLDHKVTIAAWRFSKGALRKIGEVGGEALTIDELVKRNPKGSGIKLMR